MKKILVICAHPDDETLGMGGTILFHTKKKDIVNVLILADGELGRTNPSQSKIKRKNQAKKAASILGIKSINFLDYKDQTLDIVPLSEISQKISSFIDKFNPELVFTHHWSDVNQDHRRTFEATLIATRPSPSSKVKGLLCFETPSSTEWGFVDNQFSPNYFVDITSYIQGKIRAFSQYLRELESYPHPRSKESLINRAKYWGSSVGIKHAEPFQIVRKIEN